MPDDNSSPGDALTTAVQFGGPLLNGLLWGTAADEQSVIDERIKNHSLNGSGANDPDAAARAPAGIMEFIFGKDTGKGTKTGGFVSNPLYLLLALALVWWFFFRK